MAKNNARSKEARQYMSEHPGTKYTEALRAVSLDKTSKTTYPIDQLKVGKTKDGSNYFVPYPESPSGDCLMVVGGSSADKSNFAHAVMEEHLSRVMSWDSSLHGAGAFLDATGQGSKVWINHKNAYPKKYPVFKWHPRLGEEAAQYFDPRKSVVKACLELGREFRYREMVLRKNKAFKWSYLDESVLSAEKFSPLLIVIDDLESLKTEEIILNFDNGEITVADWIHYIIQKKASRLGIFVLFTNEVAIASGKWSEVATKRILLDSLFSSDGGWISSSGMTDTRMFPYKSKQVSSEKGVGGKKIAYCSTPKARGEQFFPLTFNQEFKARPMPPKKNVIKVVPRADIDMVQSVTDGECLTIDRVLEIVSERDIPETKLNSGYSPITFIVDYQDSFDPQHEIQKIENLRRIVDQRGRLMNVSLAFMSDNSNIPIFIREELQGYYSDLAELWNLYVLFHKTTEREVVETCREELRKLWKNEITPTEYKEYLEAKIKDSSTPEEVGTYKSALEKFSKYEFPLGK